MNEVEIKLRLEEIRTKLGAAQTLVNEAFNALAELQRDLEAARAERAAGEMGRWSDGSHLLTVERVPL